MHVLDERRQSASSPRSRRTGRCAFAQQSGNCCIQRYARLRGKARNLEDIGRRGRVFPHGVEELGRGARRGAVGDEIVENREVLQGERHKSAAAAQAGVGRIQRKAGATCFASCWACDAASTTDGALASACFWSRPTATCSGQCHSWAGPRSGCLDLDHRHDPLEPASSRQTRRFLRRYAGGARRVTGRHGRYGTPHSARRAPTVRASARATYLRQSFCSPPP